MRLKLLNGQRFALLTVQERLLNTNYRCVCDCGKITEVRRGNRTHGATKSCGCLRSVSKQGSKNPAWTGDAVGYSGVHTWIRDRYPKPLLCELCGTQPSRDLANKSGVYKRDLADWWYLCRKCHMISDGRIDRLRASSRSRRGVPKRLWKGGSQNG